MAGKLWPADASLASSASVLFGAVAIPGSAAGDAVVAKNDDAVGLFMDANRLLKAIGLADGPLLAEEAHVKKAAGVIQLRGAESVDPLVKAAKLGKIWECEGG